ncbi:sulfite exporter TauE/SafE family protein [Allonocardiopsis opalescens]|uniref:Probable membrane transporter protein n=1 Tax=Allonocardiopsis opalescens TaxID=1144618 RepID=A0A2T0PU17_9ACTN|nr:sulfite exporter TauE/SafE family protein [Allonocardiopsis opalescens]PRX92397.1 hypothetical protein CLV72_110157 [Allonocardiopsis opalescens]
MADWAIIAITGAAVLLGSLVQSSVGLGVGLIAAPVLTLLAPELMPGAMLIVTFSLPLLTTGREMAHIDWRGIRWAFAGRIAGTVAGVWVVAMVSRTLLDLLVAGVILTAVILSVTAPSIRRSPATLVAAGTASGVFGTATSIGGPPVALLYQHAPGPEVRATLGAFLGLGTALSIASLAVAGQLSWDEVVAGLWLLPFLLAGFALAGPLRRYLDGGRTRTALLAVSALSATVLAARALL